MNKCLVKVLNNQIILVYYLRSFKMLVFLFLLNLILFVVNPYLGLAEGSVMCLVAALFNLLATIVLSQDVFGDKNG